MPLRQQTGLALAAALVIGASALAADGNAPGSPDEPSTAAVQVPKTLLERMDAGAQAPSPTVPREQAKAAFEKAMKAVLEMGRKAEKDYPNAANLHEVRIRMLQASDMLRRLTLQKAYQTLALQIAHRILGSRCPPAVKAQADWYVTRHNLRENRSKPQETAGEIRKFVARYDKTDAAAESLMYATILATQYDLKKLSDELADRLQAEHSQHAEARDLLRRMGRHPDVGKPFAVKLTRLNGRKLSLPGDLLGKVVVIDFWATWCGPCVGEVPHMKKVYEKYKNKGVEFVGISLDRTRRDVERFVKSRQINWIHTYDGRANPAADKYGINAIPSLWVIGKDGKVFSDSARGRLEQTIVKALAAPTTAPATKAPAAK